MQVTTGTVVNGKVVLDGVALLEGTRVTVRTHLEDEPAVLTSEQEAALRQALDEIERGEFASLDKVLAAMPCR